MRTKLLSVRTADKELVYFVTPLTSTNVFLEKDSALKVALAETRAPQVHEVQVSSTHLKHTLKSEQWVLLPGALERMQRHSTRLQCLLQ